MFSKKLVTTLLVTLVLVVFLTTTVFAAAASEAYKGTPTIDGKADDIWGSAKVMEANVKQTVSAKDTGATAKVKALWDENFLYVYAEVTDAVVNVNQANVDAGQQWETDSVEFFINDGDNAVMQYRIDANNNRSFGGSVPGDKFTSSAVTKTDSGYVIEAALPFKKAMAAGNIGFDIQVNDDQGSGKREGIFGWSQTSGNAWAETTPYGTLNLLADAAPVAAAPAETAPAEANPGTGDVGVVVYAALAGVSGLALAARKRFMK